jgi:hypothetical protein
MLATLVHSVIIHTSANRYNLTFQKETKMSDSKIVATVKANKFKSLKAMVEFTKTLTPADHAAIVKGFGMEADSDMMAKMTADYIVQGIHKTMKGKELVAYVKQSIAKVVATPEVQAALAAPAPSVAETVETDATTVETVSVVKAVKSKAPAGTGKAPRVKHGDFVIVERKDRGGWEGWYAGKAEAFRPTVEKVNAFFQKKYGQTGNVLA